MMRDGGTHTHTNIHAHKRATGKTEIAKLDASGAVYPALLLSVLVDVLSNLSTSVYNQSITYFKLGK